MKRRTQGFTIVELTVVIIVIGILSVVGVIAYNGVTQRAVDNSLQADLEKVAVLQTDYGIENQTGGKDWYSGQGVDADLQFTPSSGNVIDTVADETDYCIRAYNSSASVARDLTNALVKGSSDDACDRLGASPPALVDSPDQSFDTLTWVERTSAGSRGWTALAMSDDGDKILAADSGGYLYTSTDSGETWVERTSAGSRSWSDVASSSDGTKLVASTYGYIYTSADSGATWTERASAEYWESVASSADGSVLYAGTSTIHRSTDSGVSWTQLSAPFAGSSWISIATIDDGSVVVASRNGAEIYTSSDTGATWDQKANSGSSGWGDVTLSQNGQSIAVYRQGSSLLVSSDGGESWDDTTVGTGYCNGVAASMNGSKLIAGINGSYIFTSQDQGVTWDQRVTPVSGCWHAMASSADGRKVVIAGSGRYIYTGAFAP